MDEMSEIFWEERVFQTRITLHPDLPDSVWNIVREEMDEKMTFFNAMAEVYASELTEKEINKIFDLLNSDLMKRYSKVESEIYGLTDNEVGEIIRKEFSENELMKIEEMMASDTMAKFTRVMGSSTERRGRKAMEPGREIPRRITKFLKERGFIE